MDVLHGSALRLLRDFLITWTISRHTFDGRSGWIWVDVDDDQVAMVDGHVGRGEATLVDLYQCVLEERLQTPDVAVVPERTDANHPAPIHHLKIKQKVSLLCIVLYNARDLVVPLFWFHQMV